MREYLLAIDAGQESAGFSLIEALVSIAFLTIVAVTLLEGMTYCLRLSEEAQQAWHASLKKWNQVQELRSEIGFAGEPLMVLPEAPPMRCQKVQSEPNEVEIGWVVLLSSR